MAELMQSRVALDNLLINPGIFAFRTCSDHTRKCLVDGNFKRFPARETPQRMRDVEIIQRQDGAGFGRKPLDRVVLHGHWENTEPVALEQKFGVDHCR